MKYLLQLSTKKLEQILTKEDQDVVNHELIREQAKIICDQAKEINFLLNSSKCTELISELMDITNYPSKLNKLSNRIESLESMNGLIEKIIEMNICENMEDRNNSIIIPNKYIYTPKICGIITPSESKHEENIYENKAGYPVFINIKYELTNFEEIEICKLNIFYKYNNELLSVSIDRGDVQKVDKLGWVGEAQIRVMGLSILGLAPLIIYIGVVGNKGYGSGKIEVENTQFDFGRGIIKLSKEVLIYVRTSK